MYAVAMHAYIIVFCCSSPNSIQFAFLKYPSGFRDLMQENFQAFSDSLESSLPAQNRLVGGK